MVKELLKLDNRSEPMKQPKKTKSPKPIPQKEETPNPNSSPVCYADSKELREGYLQEEESPNKKK
jgi:hypothetical protein